MDFKFTFEDGSEVIAHFGIKGMKWGVWNDETKKRYTSQYPTIGEYTKKKLGYKEDIVVPKGTNVYRVSKNKKDTGDWRYVSPDTNSRDFYKNVYAKELQEIIYGNKDPIYEQTYETTEDLKSPGLKKRTDMLKDIFNSPEFKDAMIKNSLSWTVKSEKALKSINDGKKYVDKALSSDDKYVRNLYDTYSKNFDNMYGGADKYKKAKVASQIIATSDILKNKYKDRLQKEGYNAVLDDHGAYAGPSRIGDIPMVVLNADKSLKQIGQEQVNFAIYDKLKDKYPEHSVGERQWADRTRQVWGKQKGAYYLKDAPATVYEQYSQKHKL